MMNNKQKALEVSQTYGIMYKDSCGYYSSSEGECYTSALAMAEYKDEQFKEEKKELLVLVEMLPVNETNQTIIEDLKGLLK